MIKAILKFSTIAGLLAVLILLIIGVLIGNNIYTDKSSSLKFINNSGQAISSITILVAGKACSVKGLESNGELNCYFQDLHDSNYQVRGFLKDNTEFRADLGYVTGGMNFNHKITINESRELSIEAEASI